MRFWLAILLLTGLTACVGENDSPRYQFGVSADRPVSTPIDNPKTVALLDWKATQICTRGYRLVRQDTMPTERGADQIVDNHVHCNDYYPSFDPRSISWQTMF